MKIDTRDMVSVTDVGRNGISYYVNEAALGRTFAVLKNNRVEAVIAGRDLLERLQDLAETEENLRLWTAALARVATDDGARFALEDVAAEFGIDLDDADESDDGVEERRSR